MVFQLMHVIFFFKAVSGIW